MESDIGRKGTSEKKTENRGLKRKGMKGNLSKM